MTVLEVLAPSANASPPWQMAENPRIRGVLQNRMTGVTGASVPGAGAYKPATAMRVELRPFSNADITVTATANATSSATSLTMSTGNAAALFDKDYLHCVRTNEMLRVNGTPSSNTVQVIRGTPGYAAATSTVTGDTFTVPCGDVSDSNNTYATSRAEVFHDLKIPTYTDPALWANPVGSIRWFQWAMFVPSDFVPAPDGDNWLVVMQVKGLYGGGPPLAVEVNRGNWRIGGTRGNAGAFPTSGFLDPIIKDTWTDFILGMKLSPDPAVGWVELWINRAASLPRTTVATMDYQVDGVTADPVYIKTGIYRNPLWACTHVLHFGPLTVADSSLVFPPIIARVNAGEHWGAQA